MVTVFATQESVSITNLHVEFPYKQKRKYLGLLHFFMLQGVTLGDHPDALCVYG